MKRNPAVITLKAYVTIKTGFSLHKAHPILTYIHKKFNDSFKQTHAILSLKILFTCEILHQTCDCQWYHTVDIEWNHLKVILL